MCASQPQACTTLGIVKAYGARVRSAKGSAFMSAHSAILGSGSGHKSQVKPVPPRQHFGVRPCIGQQLGDKLCGGKLLATQLRIAVDVAAPRDQVVVVGSLAKSRLCRRGSNFCAAAPPAPSHAHQEFRTRQTVVCASMTAPSRTAWSPLGLAGLRQRRADEPWLRRRSHRSPVHPRQHLCHVSP
uniref:L308_F1_11 n=1 Tax=Mycobacterium leprae TaxID=1769 RepID=Q49912_MYCLR|nr:L308_F1_11 [Mycobacterium leprae]